MNARGYWLAQYLPISRLIRDAQGQYERAFLETETDGGDTTYFLIHQLELIDQAITDLHLYGPISPTLPTAGSSSGVAADEPTATSRQPTFLIG